MIHITLAARPQERSRLNHPSSSILPLRQSSGGDVHASCAESPKSVNYRCRCDDFKTKVVGEEPVVVRSADFTMSRLLLALRDDAVLHHGIHQVIQIVLLDTSCSPCCPDVSVAIFLETCCMCLLPVLVDDHIKLRSERFRGSSDFCEARSPTS